MKLDVFKLLAVIALATLGPLAAVTSGVAFLGAHNPNTSAQAVEDGTQYDDWQGDDSRVWKKLWSGDNDDQEYNERTFDEDGELLRETLNHADWKWTEPPQMAEDWNSVDVNDWPSSGEEDAYLAGPTITRSGSYGPMDVEDLHITFFAGSSITRLGTTAFEEDLGVGEDTKFIGTSGRVYAVIDYRTEVQEDDDGGDYPKTYYSREESYIEEARLIAEVDGGDVLLDTVTRPGTGPVVFSYNNLSRDTSYLRLEIDHNGSAKTKTVNPAEHEDDGGSTGGGTGGGSTSDPCGSGEYYFAGACWPGRSDSGSSDSGSSDGDSGCRIICIEGDRDLTRYNHEPGSETIVYNNGTTTATDTVNVQVSEPSPTGRVAYTPDGGMEATINTDTYWSEITLPDGEASGLYHFYTIQSAGFDYISHRYKNDSGTQSEGVVPSPVKGAGIHFFPAQSSITISNESDSTVEMIGGTSLVPPAFPDNVSLKKTSSDSYQRPENVLIKSDEYAPGDIVVKGVTKGSASEVNFSDRELIAPTDLELTVESVNDENGTAVVEVYLTYTNTSAGSTLPFNARPGTVTLEGETIDVNRSGVWRGEIDLNDEAYVNAKFTPIEWYKLSQEQRAYAPSSDRAEVGGVLGRSNSSVGVVVSAIDHLAALLVGLLPAFVLLWLIDRATTLTLWPPWKGFEQFRWD